MNNAVTKTLKIKPVMTIQELNQSRTNSLLTVKAMQFAANMRNMQKLVGVGRGRPVTDEKPLEVLSRDQFPSRQTYRAHLRAWAKQIIRFSNAEERGDLAPHLRGVLASV